MMNVFILDPPFLERSLLFASLLVCFYCIIMSVWVGKFYSLLWSSGKDFCYPRGKGSFSPSFYTYVALFNIMCLPKINYLPNVFSWALFVLAALCTSNLVDSLLFIIIITIIWYSLDFWAYGTFFESPNVQF